MRLLYLATEGITRASTRFRALQYFPALREAGHVPSLSAFFGGAPASSGRGGRFASGFLRRLDDVRRATDFDAVVVQRELFPYAWNALAGLVATRSRLIFDLDDAVWSAQLAGWRRVLFDPANTRLLAQAAHAIFAGNEFLADYARKWNKEVVVVPTVVDTSVYKPRSRRADGPLVVGWIGSPTTAPYLNPVLDVVDELGRSFDFVLRIVGAGTRVQLQNVRVESLRWALSTEPETFASLDIGVYPLPDSEWAQGKCGLKSIQFMASGVAHVASPIGVVSQIVRQDIDGLWARSRKEWKDALASLLEQPYRRERIVEVARARAVTEFSVSVLAPRIVSLLEQHGAP